MTILVTGATGNVGRLVVDHLVAAGAASVRALTTDPVRAALPVAAVSLLEDGHAGRAYVLTGPQTLTRLERVRLIGSALGRKILFVELTREQAVQQLSPVMGEYAEWYVDGVAQLVEYPQAAVPTVAEVTGRPGTTFAEWADANAHHFR